MIYRIFRGGSFYYDNRDLRATCRSRYWPVNWNDDIGFRLIVRRTI